MICETVCSQFVNFKQTNLRNTPNRRSPLIRIGSFNIQKTSMLAQVAQVATHYDIFFIQEFKATAENIQAMEDYATGAELRFYSSPTSPNSLNSTGTFVKPSTITVVGSHEMNSIRDHKQFGTDLRIKTVGGEHVIIQNLYLPTANKSLQADILRDTEFCFGFLKDIHSDLELIFGGDLNHSMEHNGREEREPRLAIIDLCRLLKMEDVAAYDRSISTFPTNQSRTCRRIDRLYFPTSWRNKAVSYLISKPPLVSSTHHMIAVEFGMDSLSTIQVGQPRFKYPLGRLQGSFASQKTTWLNPRWSIDEAIFAIQNDGRNYISFMGQVRKRKPRFASELLSGNLQKLTADYCEEALKTFFQTKRLEPTVFETLSDERINKLVDTTLGIINLATDYYLELYSTPPSTPVSKIRAFVSTLSRKLSIEELLHLDRPFEVKELFRALQSTDKSTAPGPDGIQFPVLEHYWNELGPILTRSANEIMHTGELPDCFRTVLITLIPKRATADSNDIKDLRPISLTNTSLKVIAKAICSRLQQVLHKLISPHQRGFMRGRKINQNTMEFFTMIQLIQEDRKTGPRDRYQSILMADFTKAFDRISHEYLHCVLQKMGFGGNILRMIMLILRQQEGQLFINNCEGFRFPLECGTRQGNPLSPLLFNLALEPFLASFGYTDGIQLRYQRFHITTMRYHAFADDVNVYLHDLHDYKIIADAIREFEVVSNSKVSADKS